MTMTYRLLHIDDHEAMRLGFAAIVADTEGLELAASVATVDDALPLPPALDLVVLDLRLADDSSIADNIGRLSDAGARVVCLSAAEDPAAVREAALSGALGIIRKTESADVLRAALAATAAGETVATVDWAAALDGDPQLASAELSPKEETVLAMYAAGQKTVSVASRLGVSEKTVAEYVRRIRMKYARIGRPAPSRVDLYRRALEDGFISAGDGEAHSP